MTHPAPRRVGLHIVELALHVRDLLTDAFVLLDRVQRADVQVLRAKEEDLRDEVGRRGCSTHEVSEHETIADATGRRRTLLVRRVRVEGIALLLRRVDLRVLGDIDARRVLVIQRVDLINLVVWKVR